MIKKIIEISQAKTYLSIRLGQLVVKSNDAEERSIPCEDIGVLLVDHSGVTYTHSVFTELLRYGAAIVLCGGNHQPSGMLLPLESNTLQAERFTQQIKAKEPVKKKLWQQVIRAKIKHQAKIAGKDSNVYKSLMALREQVRSGDPDNIEAQASKKFWSVYLADITDPSATLGMTAFHRNIDGAPPNNLLNYGYMVIRAAVARALCSAGLLPCLGIHHHNRYNAFCLADDVMEPFRGFVESKVKEICEIETAVGDLTQQIKARLLEVLYQEVTIGKTSGPLMVGLHRTAASLQRCFAGEQKGIELPEL
ncbi:MAG: type II CRISPR-associated endonuclease Cas1 [Phycisphaerae bacterium]|jgi:CRISPR-associated protein Cas1